MDTIKAIMSRRSVRSWTQELVSDEKRKIILEAGMNAPSAADARPWEFVVMDDPSVIQKFTQMGGTEMLAESTLLILICGDDRKEVYKGFWPQDCSCAAQNMQLAAQDQGVGAVWIAVYPIEQRVQLFRDELGIPNELTPFALLAMGMPNEFHDPEYRYDEQKVHINKW